ncbi:MAG: hypothetical protein WC859_05285 [Elusimicrobiota bacterium]|jgi:hypothetical protein
MNFNRFFYRLQEPTRFWPILLVALLILGGLSGFRQWLDRQVAAERMAFDELSRQVEPLAQTLDRDRSLWELKIRDVAQLKAGFSDQALNRKTLFETGLSLQEERRLLEKQLEIITTYLTVDPALQRVFLMQGEQPLESYPIDYLPPRAFPVENTLVAPATGQTVAVSSTSVVLPAFVRIISKERFANPERGHSEQVNGQLQYNPPQVGTSIRSNALGQYVIFTNSKLILHGPPLNEQDHEKFPHICLGLNLDAARRLYQHSFIGTKILLKSAIAANTPPH